MSDLKEQLEKYRDRVNYESDDYRSFDQGFDFRSSYSAFKAQKDLDCD